ncbi:MAG: DUF86 domain-containing protein [Nitrospirae bacterium]|nr:DUF86 domain-containing protein [Nitrospirota bacterium]
MNITEIQSKLNVVITNLENLKAQGEGTYEEFMSDSRNVDSSLYRLQTSIQALLDIGAHIVAVLGLGSPGSNAEIITTLCDAGYIGKDKAGTYVRMAQFRNRVVHLYDHIDTEEVYGIIKNELGDIKSFFSDLIEIIEKNPD